MSQSLSGFRDELNGQGQDGHHDVRILLSIQQSAKRSTCWAGLINSTASPVFVCAEAASAENCEVPLHCSEWMPTAADCGGNSPLTRRSLAHHRTSLSASRHKARARITIRCGALACPQRGGHRRSR